MAGGSKFFSALSAVTTDVHTSNHPAVLDKPSPAGSMKRKAEVTPREALDRDTFVLVLDYVVGDRGYWTKVYNEVMGNFNKRCTGRCNRCFEPTELPLGIPAFCEWCMLRDELENTPRVAHERGDHGCVVIRVWRREMYSTVVKTTCMLCDCAFLFRHTAWNDPDEAACKECSRYTSSG